MNRGDLSHCLVHLTRGATNEAAGETFLEIIQSGRLLGSARDIRGGYKCVCFSEAPLAVLAQALSLPAVHGMRYAPFGVMVRKEWLFAKGGRPVIYQPEVEFDHLGESHRFRHVRYEPANGHDFTWEREWRIRTEALEITPPEVTFVVPTRTWEERMQDSHAGRLRLGLWFDSDFAQAISRPPWHFVVLEDLGMQIDLS